MGRAVVTPRASAAAFTLANLAERLPDAIIATPEGSPNLRAEEARQRGTDAICVGQAKAASERASGESDGEDGSRGSVDLRVMPGQRVKSSRWQDAGEKLRLRSFALKFPSVDL
jgi:hypothetical protein